jgi:hypothetical protein
MSAALNRCPDPIDRNAAMRSATCCAVGSFVVEVLADEAVTGGIAGEMVTGGIAGKTLAGVGSAAGTRRFPGLIGAPC